MRTLTPFTRSTLVVALLASGAASALATTPGADLAALVYAGGEAIAPEAEARLRALTTTPGGMLSRDEVRLQLAEARQDGSLSGVGEIAEPPSVLLARSAANERQTRQILAAHEAERQRVAALEAQAQAQRLADAQRQAEEQRQVELQARQAAAPAPRESADSGAIAAAAELGASPPTTGVDPSANTDPARAASPDPAERDAPTPLPAERPFTAPVEVPINRASDLPDEVLIDKD